MKEIILAGVISIIGGQTNLLKDSIKPTSPSAYGVRQIEIDGPGPIVTLKERFTYSVDSYTFEIIKEIKGTSTNTTSSTIKRHFTINIPGDTFKVNSYSSVSNHSLKFATVKNLVKADSLDKAYPYEYLNISIAPGKSVTYGVEHEKLVLRIKEVKESRHCSWFNWSNYAIESTLYFDVTHENYGPFLDI